MIYKLSSEAVSDLEEIWLYTVENWSVEQADRYLNLIFDEIEYLCTHPHSGTSFGFIREGYLSSRVKSHFIFYTVENPQKELKIIRVLHQQIDLENQLY